jgi:tetratricopeptide (TPR) repeat protein
LQERLQALDRATELNPHLVYAHLLRAKLLAEAERFDEARAACHPEIFGGDLPLSMRNAAAMVEAESGNMEQALEQMNTIVTEEPNNYEAWSHLADWTRRDEGRKMEYLKAANELVRLGPHYAISFGYLGAARHWNGDRAGAKEAFKRSLEIAPDYDFGAFHLFDLELEDGEIESAKETLGGLKRHIGGDWVTLRELELAVKERDAETATNLLRHLCQEAAAERQLLDRAVEQMEWNKMDGNVDRVLGESLDVATANPIVGDVWADRWIKRGEDKRCLSGLEATSERTPAWRYAAATYLQKIPQAARLVEVQQFIRNNAVALGADDYTWGIVGYALLESARCQDAVEWLSDWRSRASVQSWMLLNYVLALRALDRDAEAYEVGQEALRLAPDHATDDHRALIALDDALANQVATAAQQLDQIRYDGLGAWTMFRYNTAATIVQAARSSRSGLKQFSKLAQLRGANPFFWKDKVLFTSHCRATLRMAESNGNVLVKAWAYLLVGGLQVKRSLIQAQDSRIGKRLRILGGG